MLVAGSAVQLAQRSGPGMHAASGDVVMTQENVTTSARGHASAQCRHMHCFSTGIDGSGTCPHDVIFASSQRVLRCSPPMPARSNI